MTLAWASSAKSANIKPIMIYDSELILDKSWNEAIHNGVQKFQKKTGIAVKETKAPTAERFKTAIKEFAKEGYDPIMINNLDGAIEVVIRQIMAEYPSRRFVVFNGTFNVPNAHYFVFSTQESSFLAGYLAAKKSKTGKLGFIGGMDIPLIRNFMCGYVKGAKYANPDASVLSAFVANDFSAWASPDKAHDIAVGQINDGADVIFAPAGGSTQGALQAASEKGVLGVGVDSNQNHLFPGSVLTSAMVRVDNAAFLALMAAHRGVWRDQVKIMGLQENGVELAFDQYNAALIPAELRRELDDLKAKIVLGEIELPNFIFTNECKGPKGKLF